MNDRRSSTSRDMQGHVEDIEKKYNGRQEKRWIGNIQKPYSLIMMTASDSARFK